MSVHRFPIDGTPLGQWIRQARQVSATTNIVGVRVWCIKHVPEQFRDVVLNSVRRRV
jgi:hypothetical protein